MFEERLADDSIFALDDLGRLQMVAQRFVHPLQQWFDLNGEPANGYRLYFYQTLTNTPLAVYSDETLTTPITQPVVADSTGVFEVIFMQDAVYKVILNDASATSANGRLGVTVYTQDPYDATQPPTTIESFYDFPVYIEGKPSNSEVFPVYDVARTLKLPANLEGSVFNIGTLPTSSLQVKLYKGATQIGTVTFSTLGVATVSFLSDVTFLAQDLFSLGFPSSADATGANISFTFVFTVV